MTELVPVDTGDGVLDTAVTERLAMLDAAAADCTTRCGNTAEAYAADWRTWTRFVADLSGELGEPIPDTATNPGVLVAFVVWHERLQLASATIRRRLMGVVVTQRQRGIAGSAGRGT